MPDLRCSSIWCRILYGRKIRNAWKLHGSVKYMSHVTRRLLCVSKKSCRPAGWERSHFPCVLNPPHISPGLYLHRRHASSWGNLTLRRLSGVSPRLSAADPASGDPVTRYLFLTSTLSAMQVLLRPDHRPSWLWFPTHGHGLCCFRMGEEEDPPILLH